MIKEWLRKVVGCPDPIPPEPPDPNRKLLYAYYGADSAQITSTYQHVNLVHIGAWGDWESAQGRINLINDIVAMAQQAKGANLPVMLTMDFCLFEQTNPRVPLPGEVSRTYMDTFFTRLRNENLLDTVVAFYVIDEPNIHEVAVSNQDMINTNNWLRAVAGFYWDPTKPLPLAVIYGAGGGNSINNLPGISTFDWCGIDNYGSNIFSNGQYNTLLSQMRLEQQTIYVPGGSNPWREDPMPYYTRALQDPRVVMIMPFIWITPDGIAGNGMAPQYEAVGSLIVNP